MYVLIYMLFQNGSSDWPAGYFDRLAELTYAEARQLIGEQQIKKQPTFSEVLSETRKNPDSIINWRQLYDLATVNVSPTYLGNVLELDDWLSARGRGIDIAPYESFGWYTISRNQNTKQILLKNKTVLRNKLVNAGGISQSLPQAQYDLALLSSDVGDEKQIKAAGMRLLKQVPGNYYCRLMIAKGLLMNTGSGAITPELVRLMSENKEKALKELALLTTDFPKRPTPYLILYLVFKETMDKTRARYYGEKYVSLETRSFFDNRRKRIQAELKK